MTTDLEPLDPATGREMYLDERSHELADGLRAAWRARRAIAVWAVTSATLGTLLYVLDE